MGIVAAPIKQTNHKYIPEIVDKWLDIHFGDTSFNGRAVIGHKKNDGGIYTLTARPINELKEYAQLMHFSKHLDYYITANTVSGVERRESNLFGLQNIVIDIDCHIEGKLTSVPEMVDMFKWYAKRDLWNTEIVPTPNSIVSTGRGIQLWWALVPCYGSIDYGKSRFHHDKIKNTIMDHIEVMLSEYSELDSLHVDRGASSNPVGYFRFPCTYNTKAKKYSSVEILHDTRYDQRELTLLKEPERNLTLVPPKHIPMLDTDRELIQNFHNTGVKRIIQLVNLRNLRNNNVGAETRNNFNFAVYNTLRMTNSHEDAMGRLKTFNSGFIDPMSERELENCVSSAKKLNGYKYTNEKLIELLNVTDEERSLIDLHPFEGKYRPWVHSKPNASRDAARKALKDDRNSKIISMVESGLSQAEVARQLGIGKNTVGRVMKKHSELSAQEECHHFGSIYVLNTISQEEESYTSDKELISN